MSWNHSLEYAKFNIKDISNQEDFDTLITNCTNNLLEHIKITNYKFDSLDDLDMGLEIHELMPIIKQIIAMYIRDITFADNSTSFHVYTEYDSDVGDDELASWLYKFFFTVSSTPFFLINGVTEDRSGIINYQTVGHWCNGQIIFESAEKYLVRQPMTAK